MAYNGTTEIASGLRAMGTGGFPLVDSADIRVTDEKRLDAVLAEKLDAENAIPKPAQDGTEGDVLRINSSGDPVWTDPAVPTDSQVREVVTDWLDNNPTAIPTELGDQIDEIKDCNSASAITNNLLVFGDISYKKQLSPNSGTPGDNNNYLTTDYIPVVPGELLYAYHCGRYWFYDSSKDPMTGDGRTDVWPNAHEMIAGTSIMAINVMAGAAYMRVSVPNDYFGKAFMLRPSGYDLKTRMDLDGILDKVSANNLVKHSLNSGIIRTADGGVSTSSTGLYTDYVDVSNYAKIIYTRICTTASYGTWGLAFYDNSKTFISGSGQGPVLNSETYTYRLEEITVPTGAKYARFTWISTLDAEFAAYDAEQYNSNLDSRVTQNTAAIEQNTADLTAVKNGVGRNVAVDYANAQYKTGYISGAGLWLNTTGSASYFIPVPDWVEKCSITANQTAFTIVAILTKEPAVGETVEYADGGARTSIGTGETKEFTMPTTPNPYGGSYYLCVLKLYSESDRTPASTNFSSLNGVQYLYGAVDSMEDDVDEVKSHFPDYTGKKMSILGDSISTFVYDGDKVDGKAPAGCTTTYPGNSTQYQRSDVTSPALTWWGRVLDYFGMVLGINESWAGSTIAYNPNQTNSGKYTADNCMCSAARIGHLGENGTPDVIIIFGGTNDINHHRVGNTTNMRYAVGELDSAHNPYDYDNFPMVTDTYYGSITTMILRVQHMYPNATILMLLPYFCTSTHTSSGDRATPYDQNDFSKAAIDVCNYLGVEYLDLRKIINLYDVSSLLFDGLHPKANGMAAIAKAVIHKLNSML